MTEQMDRIWENADKEIAYREQEADNFRFTSSYHGNDRYLISMHTPGASGMHNSLHLTRDDLRTLAHLCAAALGGAYYDADEDADSELVGSPKEDAA